MLRFTGLRYTHRGLALGLTSPFNAALGSRLLARAISNHKPVRSSLDSKTNKGKAQSARREDIWTFPNILTITRLVAAPCIGYFIVRHAYPQALGLMIYASVTDFVDGYLARKYNKQTIFGSIADPAADKALMVTLASCLTYSGVVPWWCGLTILGRDLLLACSALIVRYRTLPPPKSFKRFWDMSIPSVKVEPTTISKWNTFFQMLYLGTVLASPVVPVLPSDFQTAMAVFVTGTTIWSGLSYVFSKTAVKRL